eukprot:2421793-Rhodomonas_salina.2
MRRSHVEVTDRIPTRECIHCVIKYKKPQFQYNLYQEGVQCSSGSASPERGRAAPHTIVRSAHGVSARAVCTRCVCTCQSRCSARYHCTRQRMLVLPACTSRNSYDLVHTVNSVVRIPHGTEADGTKSPRYPSTSVPDVTVAVTCPAAVRVPVLAASQASRVQS